MQDRPRILFVTDQIPGNMGMGGTQRTTHLYHALAAIAETDTFLLANPEVFHPTKSAWHREQFRVIDCVSLPKRGEYFPWNLIRSISPSTVDKVATQVGDAGVPFTRFEPLAKAIAKTVADGKYDLIVSRYMMPTVATGLLDDPRVLVDLDDLDTVAFRTRAEAPGVSGARKVLMKRKSAMIDRIVPPLWGRWGLAWACCDEDAEIISTGCKQFGRAANVALLPNIPNDPPAPPTPAPGNKVLLSVASLKWHPNQAGIDWFVHQVWPAIRKAHPTATYRIVGGGLPAKLKESWTSVAGVVVVGYADDLAAEYAGCDLAVAAVFEGSGTKIKVLEALAYDRTVAVVSHALRGYEKVLHHDREVMLADEPAMFAEGCIALLNDPDKAREMAARGKAVVDREFSFAKFASIVKSTIESTLEKVRGGSPATV